METFTTLAKSGFESALAMLAKNAKIGEGTFDPNLALALILFAVAGMIILFCACSFLMGKRPSSIIESGSDIASLESRIQALEVALMDHRTLAISLKNQSKADFAYFKQEMKNLYFAIEELDIPNIPVAPKIRAAGK